MHLQDVNNLPSAGQKVSPLKVKRSAKGNVPWLMATTYMTSAGGGQEGRRLAGKESSRFQMNQQAELTREQQLQDIEVRSQVILIQTLLLDPVAADVSGVRTHPHAC